MLLRQPSSPKSTVPARSVVVSPNERASPFESVTDIPVNQVVVVVVISPEPKSPKIDRPSFSSVVYVVEKKLTLRIHPALKFSSSV